MLTQLMSYLIPPIQPTQIRSMIMNLIFYVTFYHVLVLHLLRENKTLNMVRSLPTTLQHLMG